MGLLDRWRSSGRARAVAASWSSSPALTVLLAINTALTAILPIASLAAMGVMIGRISPAISDGLSSPAGDALMRSVVGVCIAFLGAMITAPAGDFLEAAIKVRVTHALRLRLARAVSQPSGVAHLEDAAVLDRLSLAQGTLSQQFPAEAPVVLARVLGYRLVWLLGCVVLGIFRWWMGIAFFVMWQAVRRPILEVVRTHVSALGGEAAVMRRADYFVQLATKPAGAKELRVFGLGGWVVDRYREHWSEGMAELWRIRAGISKTVAKVGVLVLVVYTAACGYIAHEALYGGIDLEILAVLLTVLFMTMNNGGVSFDDIALEYQLAGLPEVDGLEADLASPPAASQGVAPPPLDVGITFESVRFRYPGGERDVFDDLQLTLPAGRSTAIVGANGAGKTTLIKLLARLHEPTEGQIVVDSVPLQEIDPCSWQRQVAAVFQDFIRFPVSAADNIAYGAPEHLGDRDGIVEVAGRAGIRETVEALPLGWETVLSTQFTDGVDLSDGQWQRLALARALFAARHGASVLVLDEPTSWLDARGEAAFFAQFLDLTAGLTTVVISHRFSTVRLADQIVVIRDGRVAEAGTHDELLDLNRLYGRMFRLQAARFSQSAERGPG